MTSIAAIVCAHTLDRWGDIKNAIESLRAQTRLPDEIILVVDHNPELFAEAQSAFGCFSTIVANTGPRGVSGARNAAAEKTTSDVLAYLDDDAVADPEWIDHLLGWYDDPAVVGVGGTAHPDWVGQGPAWFPAAFNWVVGCSHSGISQEPAPVRNFIGCNMSIRRTAWEQIGGFYAGLGRVGSNAGGGDETDFCIRVTQEVGGLIMNDPGAAVWHRVPPDRQTLAYFLRRCRSEGRSKAHLSERAGPDAALSEERNHLMTTLPREFLRGLLDAARLDFGGIGRSAAILAGTAATLFGYAEGRVRGPAKTDAAAIPATPETNGFVPARIVTIDVSAPLSPLEPGDDRLFALVRRGPQPLGVLRLDNIPTSVELQTHLDAGFSRTANADSRSEGPLRTSRADQSTTAAVVIATRDRADSLARCLESLTTLTRLPDQVIVVDSAPKDEEAEAMVARWNSHNDMRIDYVRSERPGLAVAHNAALPLLRTDVVAFTDDDVIVDRYWLQELLENFESMPRVACVTGGIMPAELVTWPQEWVETTSGFNKGFERRVFDLDTNRPDDPLFPFTAGTMGSGANMAFDITWLRDSGGFDPALGAGTVAMGGDDLRAFYEVVHSGKQLVYEPGAIVFHHHHREPEAISRQCYGYGAGLAAYLTSVALDDPRSVWAMVTRAPQAIRHAAGIAAASGDDTFPGQTSRARRQRAGMLAGSLRYLRSRKHA